MLESLGYLKLYLKNYNNIQFPYVDVIVASDVANGDTFICNIYLLIS
jgi:hypothetical protein